ncbi:MAG TPA: hypothetical protein VF105_12260 [Gemmatimonadaceae bacterium]
MAIRNGRVCATFSGNALAALPTELAAARAPSQRVALPPERAASVHARAAALATRFFCVAHYDMRGLE